MSLFAYQKPSGQERSGNTTTTCNASKKKNYIASVLAVQSWMEKYVWVTQLDRKEDENPMINCSICTIGWRSMHGRRR